MKTATTAVGAESVAVMAGFAMDAVIHRREANKQQIKK